MATFARGYWTAKVRAHNQRVLNDIDRHTTQTAPGKITWLVTAGNEHTLRGIPAIGRSVAGAIRGTNPEAEVTK
jgi:hypothetical protein